MKTTTLRALRTAGLPAATLALTAMLFGCGGHSGTPATKAAAAPELATVTVAVAPAPREQLLDGVVEAVDQTTISAQTSGRISELPVDVDSVVHKGDVLARLRDVEPRARTEQAQAALKESEANMVEADKNYQRVKDVYDKQLIAPAQMDRATAAHDAARAQLAAAKAALAAASEQQGYTVVRAPYAGVITARPVQVGELATPGRPLLTLLSLDKLRAVVDAPQAFAAAIRAHRQARVILADGRSIAASAVTVFPDADPATHTVRVRIELPGGSAGDDAALQPGMMVKVAFTVGETPLLAIPQAALAWRGEVSGVYVVSDGGPQFRAVRAGRTLADGSVEILSGLSPGERVATDPSTAAAALRPAAGPSA
jgi:RND family efflux transporter MFP subunit